MSTSVSVSETIKLLNIVDTVISSPSPAATSTRRVDGDLDVFKSVRANFCAPTTFAPFITVRRRIDRLCLSLGTKFCGGYGMSDQSLTYVLGEIKKYAQQFEDEKQKLLSVWPQPLEAWIAAHPSEEVEIRAIAPSLSVLEKSLKFVTRVYKVNNQSEVLANAGIDDGVVAQVGNMCHQIAQEIAQDVAETWKPVNGIISQRIKGALNRWKQKAASLVFIDARLQAVVASIDETIAVLPASGKIEGRDFMALQGLISLLSNPDNIISGTMSVMLAPETQNIETQPAEALPAISPTVNVWDVEDVLPLTISVPEPVNTEFGALIPPVATPASSAWAW